MYLLICYPGAHLLEDDGNVFANLMEGKQTNSCVITNTDKHIRDCDGAGEDTIVVAGSCVRELKLIKDTIST